jgi:hypothetical protein
MEQTREYPKQNLKITITPNNDDNKTYEIKFIAMHNDYIVGSALAINRDMITIILKSNFVKMANEAELLKIKKACNM